MSKITYTSNVRIERRRGPLRVAHLPGEAQPVFFSAHGAIAETLCHRPIDAARLPRRHDRLRHRRDRRLNARDLWRRAGGASHRCE